ncbi:E3 ubiquitin-protein ligase HRD1 [Escovopsis weberi]|uniref:RING-type E3 ubiquitin transferase n=1 Tax=Escovopsis weberi TaxID=150374 RepID=A0A0M8N0N7_ESCWE|nr:E3 ubiquitin-protein ligase HRD1 [Escovopsis weberi]
MRLGWYAGVSTALAGSVVISAFHQRANFYSAMVYLAQSNFCLLVLINFILLLYSSFLYALTQICFGTLRAIEIEQLTERAWFAITETCLAMTIFREEIGAWFLVMFTALVTGKVWGWIGDGRVEFLEQQPPPNPRLFHLRLSVSLTMSFIYDVWMLRYCTNTVIQDAKRSMMVMFLFEFAVLATTSWRTAARYILCLTEQNIVKSQTKKRLHERREEVRQQRQDMIRRREQAAAAGEELPDGRESLPDPDDVDEMDIEVPGWVSKDMIKLGIYVAFFLMLLTFYGLPFHIMRDLFMTTRDFLKRLSALLRYRRAIQEMNKYPDATEQDLANENTCIICREEMHHWEPARNSVDRVRPKKLPCGHILHLGCLKSWLERQQVCPTCRSPVTGDQGRAQQAVGAQAAAVQIQIRGPRQHQDQRAPANDNVDNDNLNGHHRQDHNPPNNANHINNAFNNNANTNSTNHNAPRGDAAQQGPAQNTQHGQPHTWTFGPIRFGFGTNGQQVRELAQRFGIPNIDGNQGQPGPSTSTAAQTQTQPHPGDNLQHIGNLLQQAEQMVQREVQTLQATQQELQVVNLLMSELQRLRQRGLLPQDTTVPQPQYPPTQYPLPTQPLGAHPIGLPFPTGQHFPAQGPGLTTLPHPFPGIPPRMSSPSVARLGPFANQPAIPAGSPDLPDGVVLPPGWSLVPLQRLDGTSHPQPLQTHAGPAPAADHASASQPTPTQPSQPTPTISVPAPGVVAPSPVLPNWGGSAQLFSSASQAEHTADTEPPRADDGNEAPQVPNAAADSATLGEGEGEGGPSHRRPETTEHPDEEREREREVDGEVESSRVDKGKGKAVTVEEAADDGEGGAA